MRDLNTEFSDTETRKYAYDIDYRMHEYMLRTFTPFIKGKKSVLEMGCYKGEFTKRLIRYFDSVSVIEGSSELIEEARKNVNSSDVTFYLSRFEDSSLTEKFDAVFLVHTLEHLDNPQQVLKQIKKWLNPGGQLFLVVPNAHALSRQIAVKMGLIDYNAAVTDGEFKHGHRKTYSLDTLCHEAQQAGFNIDHHGGIFVKPLANFQFERALSNEVISEDYLEGCYQLSRTYPDLCSSIYAICSSATTH